MRRRSRRHHEQVELNITAFLNLMVILIPFLLITAVFSRVTILELNIPQASDTPPEEQKKPDEPPLLINVIVRPDSITVADNRNFSRAFRKNTDELFNWNEITDLLKNMKDRVPDKTDANILVDPEVPYSTLVEVMDKVRTTELKGDKGLLLQVPLFPDISIGDAPPL